MFYLYFHFNWKRDEKKRTIGYLLWFYSIVETQFLNLFT